MDDISKGLESVKIGVDGRSPKFQHYVTTSVPGSAMDTDDFMMQLTGCICQPSSDDDDVDRIQCSFDCVCTAVRSYGLNYDCEGRLLTDIIDNDSSLSEKPVFECNRLCPCATPSRKCFNRVVQFGVRIDGLVVFMTNNGRGWGLRTSMEILKGSFICEYAGEIIDYTEAKDRIKSRNNQTEDMNYLYALREHVAGDKVICTYVDPTNVGNVGRFINHSCEPNLLVVPVRVDIAIPRLALFTRRDIEAGEELCFDYAGNNQTTSGNSWTTSVEDVAPTGIHRKLCLCGTSTCRKYLPYDETLFESM